MTKTEFIKLNNEYKIEASGDTFHSRIDLGNGYYYYKFTMDNPKDVNYYLYHEDGYSRKKLYWAWTRKDFIEKLIKLGIIKEA